jgi:1-deoxy-D-xylulose-5-phosphate synthase
MVVGHAGTAISSALGIATGDSITGVKRKVIAVCGDGALTAGMSLEALNYAGILKKNIILILNDNKMSISRTVGAMANYLNKLRASYLYRDLKKDVASLLEKIPKAGRQMEKALHHIRAAALAPFGGAIFEELGWHYFGPIEGHNIPVMINNLKMISELQGPIMLHIITEKGYGSQNAINDPYKMHGINPGTVADGKISSEKNARPNYTDVFGDTVAELAAQDCKIAGITAAMPDGTGLFKFQEKFPDRYFDVGICEQQAVGLAGGMAKAGAKPIVAIYSTFLQRAFDQLFHEIALQKNPALFAIDRAGLVGADGPTHHGLYDIAYCRLFPEFVLMAPRDGAELKEMLAFGLQQKQPVFIRYPRTAIPDEIITPVAPLRMGQSEILRQGKNGALLAYGSMVYPAYAAAEKLHKEGIEMAVINARFAKPLDKELIGRLLKETPFMITLEEHSITGGFGSAVMEFAGHSAEIRAYANKIIPLGAPDKFVEHGPRNKLLDILGLDENGIIKIIRNKLSVNLDGMKSGI